MANGSTTAQRSEAARCSNSGGLVFSTVGYLHQKSKEDCYETGSREQRLLV